MPYNAAGVYSPPAPPTFPAVAGTVVSEVNFNNLINDIVTALSTAVVKDATGGAGFSLFDLVNITLSGTISVGPGSTATTALHEAGDDNTGIIFPDTDKVGIVAGGAEIVRVDILGLLAGATTRVQIAGADCSHFFQGTASADWTAGFVQTTGNPLGIGIYYNGAAPNGATNEFIYAYDTGGVRFTVMSNGGIANYAANNVVLSDEREKTEIRLFDAKADLEAFLAVQIADFKYIDQTHDDYNLGVIAQQVRKSHPGNARYVEENGWSKIIGHEPQTQSPNEEGELIDDPLVPIYEPREAVYSEDFHWRVVAQLQLAHKMIADLDARVKELENG